MSEEDETLADVEAEYKDLLKRKAAIMRDEIEKEEKLKAAEEVKTKEEKENEKFSAKVEAKVKEILDGKNIEDPNIEDGDISNGKGEEPVKLPEKIGFAKDWADTNKIKFSKYETLANDYLLKDEEAFAAFEFDSDSGCEDDVSAWEVEDCFADVMWQSVICKSDFLGKNITVKGLDFKAGCGGKVQIKVINVAHPSQDFTPMSPCTCMSCVSNSFLTYTLTMKTYGDYKVLCDLDLFTAGAGVRKAVIDSMRTRAKERIDNQIMTALEGATATYTEDLGGCCDTGSLGTDGDCCRYTQDLYKAVLDLEAQMRNAGYFDNSNPVLILNSDVAAYLKYKEGISVPSYIASSIKMDGIKLAAIGNIRVIESCHAANCSNTTDAVQAVLIDPDRAIGEAWGKRPEFLTDHDPIECESEKIVLRMWAAFAALDEAAIGHVTNPSSC